jgi:hypothetical protein
MTGMRYSLFCVAALMLLFVGACQQVQLPEYRAYANDHDVPRISVEDAKKDYDAGIAVIVDSRPDQTWQQERIAGSINIPGTLSDDQVSNLPKGKKIIVYCS